jgi:hypothetical protein
MLQRIHMLICRFLVVEFLRARLTEHLRFPVTNGTLMLVR